MHKVIEQYQQLSAITAQMREAAAQGEWDRLVELEQESRRQVAIIQSMDLTPTDEDMRRQKAALIRQILADDADIRNRTQTWMQQLQRIMQSARSEQQLQKAYASD